jgi:hypothetical protein
LQTSINRGPQPRIKEREEFLEIQISFKTSSSSKEALSLSKEALLKVLMPPLFTLEVYKE